MSRSAQAIAPCEVRAVIMAWIAVRMPNPCKASATTSVHSSFTMSIMGRDAGCRMRGAGIHTERRHTYVAQFGASQTEQAPENTKWVALSTMFQQQPASRVLNLHSGFTMS